MTLPLRPDRRRAATALCAALIAGLLGTVTGRANAQDEVPFITTPDRVTLAMLELAGMGAGDRLIDLGSGDGRIVITAARRFGAQGLGVELSPELVTLSQANARAAGVADRTEFKVQDLFVTPLSGASVITMYLLPAVNLQLRDRLLALAPGTRIVSHDWEMGDWRPSRSLTLDVPEKAIGRDKRSTVHLWVVPAQAQGRWCGPGAQITVSQRFDVFSASLQVDGANAPLLVVDGRIYGPLLHDGSEPRTAEVSLEARADALLPTRLPASAARFVGRRFVRASASGC